MYDGMWDVSILELIDLMTVACVLSYVKTKTCHSERGPKVRQRRVSTTDLEILRRSGMNAYAPQNDKNKESG